MRHVTLLASLRRQHDLRGQHKSPAYPHTVHKAPHLPVPASSSGSAPALKRVSVRSTQPITLRLAIMPAKVVLVTGCSAGGIGYALCQEFAARGCKVYATARSVQKMKGLEAAGCVLKALDVTNPKAVSSVVSEVLAAEGRIDVLVNNAGCGLLGSVLDTPVEAARKLFDINYFACVSLIQAVMPTMMKQRSGVIVNVGSVAAYISGAFGSHYSATKSALKSLTDSLRLELRPFGVSVVFCAPGFVRTNILTNATAAEQVFLLPDSPYQPLRHVFEEDPFAKIKNCVTPEGFAKSFVSATLSRSPPAYHRDGTLGVAVPFLAWLLPTWLKDYMLSKRAGLLTFNPPA